MSLKMNITEATPKAGLQIKVTAANPEAYLEEISNDDLAVFVQRLTKADRFSVKNVLTDGYNEHGSAGAEMVLEGKSNSFLSYGTKVLDFDGFQELSNMLLEANKSVPGFEMEFGANPETQELFLVVMADGKAKE